MDIQTATIFFMWCTILNMGMLILTTIACISFADFSYCMNNKLFSISREAFNVIVISFVGLYKLFVIVFCLIPYIALLIIG